MREVYFNTLGDKELLCTIGPASLNDRVISHLDDIGASLFRINLSHTKIKDLEQTIAFIQKRTSVPVCLDTEGAQIRTGDIQKKQVILEENAIVHIPNDPVPGDTQCFNLYPVDIVDKFEVGDF